MKTEKNRLCLLIMATLFSVVAMGNSLPQKSTVPEKWIRSVVLDDTTQPCVIVVANGQLLEDEQTEVPNAKRYLLFHGMWLQTESKVNGNMLFGQDTLPFNRADKALYSDFKDSKKTRVYDDSFAPLAFRIEYELITYRYSDTIETKEEWKKYCDSIVREERNAFLYFNKDKEGKLPQFYLEYNDIDWYDSDSFAFKLVDCDSVVKLALDPAMMVALGLDEIVFDSLDSVPIHQVVLIPQGHLPSFVDEVHIVEREEVDETATPPLPPDTKHTFNWKLLKRIAIILGWIVLSLLALVGLLTVFSWCTYFCCVLRQRGKQGTDEDEKNELKQLKKTLNDSKENNQQLENKIQSLEKKIKSLEDEIERWKDSTKYETPAKAEKGIGQLKKESQTIQERKNALEIENKDLKKVLEKLKKTPEAFRDDRDYSKLAGIIAKADDAEKRENDLKSNPSLFEASTPTGKMIAKGELLDKLKKDALLARNNEELNGSDLQKVIGFMDAPETILSYHRKDLGLYKLVEGVKNVADGAAVNINPNSIAYGWLNGRLSQVIANHNECLAIKASASTFGTDLFDTQGISDEVKKIFVFATRYTSFKDYENYWKNIIKPVFTVLNDLQDHNEVYNTRALLFYTSQLYSMACIMNEIFGRALYPISAPKINVSRFNEEQSPESSPEVGYPELADEMLSDYRFEYTDNPSDGPKIALLKNYKPLHFLLINSYFDDNRLS